MELYQVYLSNKLNAALNAVELAKIEQRFFARYEKTSFAFKERENLQTIDQAPGNRRRGEDGKERGGD